MASSHADKAILDDPYTLIIKSYFHLRLYTKNSLQCYTKLLEEKVETQLGNRFLIYLQYP